MLDLNLDFPSKLYRAKTVRVCSTNSLTVDLDLGFSVSIRRTLTLEGVTPAAIPQKHRSAAMHCLVVLLGGKRLVVRTTDEDREDNFLARVYLAERIHGNPAGLFVPHGFDAPLLEVSEFYSSLANTGYDVGAVKAILNGAARV